MRYLKLATAALVLAAVVLLAGCEEAPTTVSHPVDGVPNQLGFRDDVVIEDRKVWGGHEDLYFERPIMLPPGAGGTPPYTYSLTTPRFGGMLFDAEKRWFRRAPHAGGPHVMTYRVTDADGRTAEMQFTITVILSPPSIDLALFFRTDDEFSSDFLMVDYLDTFLAVKFSKGSPPGAVVSPLGAIDPNEYYVVDYDTAYYTLKSVVEGTPVLRILFYAKARNQPIRWGVEYWLEFLDKSEEGVYRGTFQRKPAQGTPPNDFPHGPPEGEFTFWEAATTCNKTALWGGGSAFEFESRRYWAVKRAQTAFDILCDPTPT